LGEIKLSQFENVHVIKKANFYFDGKVTSRTVLFADGTKKTLGVILPGEYTFGTGLREKMEILAGALNVLLPGETEYKAFTEGQSFEVPANSSFTVKASDPVDYCCSYLAE
jgi:uncharacterized protein YaiE (UPF0345 family)